MQTMELNPKPNLVGNEVVSKPKKAGRRKKTEEERLLEEKKILGWLLKMYDERGRMPLWHDIRRDWPEEAQEIQRVFGVWELARTRLLLLIESREEKERKIKLIEQQQIVRRAYGAMYSLEDYLQGILLVQERLEIGERMPSLREIDSVAKELGLPSGISFSRKLFHKEYWAGFVNRYLEAPRSKRSVVLEEIEVELLCLKEAKRQKLRAEKRAQGKDVRPDRIQYTTEDCLGSLLAMSQYYGNSVPSVQQIKEHNRLFGSIPLRTIQAHLGKKDTWEAQLMEYRHQQTVDEYLRRQNQLTKGQPIDFKAVARLVEQVASEGDKLEMLTLVKKLEAATLKAPATFCIKLGERKLEITAKPR